MDQLFAPLDSQSQFVLTGKIKTLLTTISRSFEAEVSTDWIPFLSSSTENTRTRPSASRNVIYCCWM